MNFVAYIEEHNEALDILITREKWMWGKAERKEKKENLVCQKLHNQV